MKKIFAFVLVMLMVAVTAQATTFDYSTPDKMAEGLQFSLNKYSENDVEYVVKYIEKFHSFVITLIFRNLSPQDFAYVSNEYSTYITPMKMTKKMVTVLFPNTNFVYAIARSESEIYWIFAEWYGIIFAFDNVKGQIVYTEPGLKVENITDLY